MLKSWNPSKIWRDDLLSAGVGDQEYFAQQLGNLGQVLVSYIQTIFNLQKLRIQKTNRSKNREEQANAFDNNKSGKVLYSTQEDPRKFEISPQKVIKEESEGSINPSLNRIPSKQRKPDYRMSSQNLMAYHKPELRAKHSVQNTPSQSPKPSIRRPSEATLTLNKPAAIGKHRLDKDPKLQRPKIDSHSQTLVSPSQKTTAASTKNLVIEKPSTAHSILKSDPKQRLQTGLKSPKTQSSQLKWNILQLETGNSPVFVRESRSNPKFEPKIPLSMKNSSAGFPLLEDFCRSPTVESTAGTKATTTKPNTTASTPTNAGIVALKKSISKPSIKKIMSEAQSGSSMLVRNQPENSLAKDLKLFNGVVSTSFSVLGLLHKPVVQARPYAHQKRAKSRSHKDIDSALKQESLMNNKMSFSTVSNTLQESPYKENSVPTTSLAACRSTGELSEPKYLDSTPSHPGLAYGLSTEPSLEQPAPHYETSVDLYVHGLKTAHNSAPLPKSNVKEFNVYQVSVPEPVGQKLKVRTSFTKTPLFSGISPVWKEKSSSQQQVQGSNKRNLRDSTQNDMVARSSSRSSRIKTRNDLSASGLASWALEIAQQSASRSSIHSKSFLDDIRKDNLRKTVTSPQSKGKAFPLLAAQTSFASMVKTRAADSRQQSPAGKQSPARRRSREEGGDFTTERHCLREGNCLVSATGDSLRECRPESDSVFRHSQEVGVPTIRPNTDFPSQSRDQCTLDTERIEELNS